MNARLRAAGRALLALACVALPLVLLFAAGLARARPGGGEHYSGSHSSGGGGSWGGSGSGSGGSGDFEIVVLIFQLLFEYPQVGVPVMVVAIGVFVYSRARSSRDPSGWSTQPVSAPVARAKLSPVREMLGSIRERDPDFSFVLFRDFLYALYAAAHEARAATGKLDELAPYLSTAARQTLLGLGRPEEVKGVIVGAMRFARAERHPGPRPRMVVFVEFEANYTETSGGREETYFAEETWRLTRDEQARSRLPERVRVFQCPSCGAPLSAVRGHTCSYCNKVVDTGEFDWLVEEISSQREPRGALLSGNVEEQGTGLPTLIDPAAAAHLEELRGRDPAFAWDAFARRVELIHGELAQAWQTREWAWARPFVSDQLFQSLSYWMDAYRKEGLRNVTKGTVSRIELCRVDSDRWYDAITARVHASGLDYTETDAGELKSGSRTRPRDYTEYWTLVRGAGVKGAASAQKACPQCGAALEVDMAGECKYCRAKVTSGSFDWVLSLIEQDEAYRG